MPLDNTDLSILKLLRQDPRIPYTQIADKLMISRITVKNRMDHMIDDNLIILSAKVNIQNQGGKMAMIGLEPKSEDLWQDCIEKMKVLPWVLMAFKSMGKSNLRVLIYGENDEILERNIDEFRYFSCVNFIQVEILGKPLIGNI